MQAPARNSTIAANLARRTREQQRALGLPAEPTAAEIVRALTHPAAELANGLLAAADSLGHEKFEDADLDQYAAIVDDDFQELRVWAHRYLLATTSSFDYIVQMQAAFERWGHLSDGQARGVLNCALAEARRAVKKHAEETAAAAAPVLTDGMYRTPAGDIFKVQVAVHGSGKLYAKRLIVEQDAERDADGHVLVAARLTFEYEQGAIRQLTADMRLSLAEAKAFGALYGSCCVCGRVLTDETSIAEGIGPICAGRLTGGDE